MTPFFMIGILSPSKTNHALKSCFINYERSPIPLEIR